MGGGQELKNPPLKDLNRGWDKDPHDFVSGQVDWKVVQEENGCIRLDVRFTIKKAQKDHDYAIGAHFFHTKEANFGGGMYKDYPGGSETKNGRTADVDAVDFGVMRTDDQGDGYGHAGKDGYGNFLGVYPNPGRYLVQFTIRKASSLPVTFYSGKEFSQDPHVIEIPERPGSE